ncbi:MAG: leucine-rich repeat protein [Verrucomicrobiia bacterium]
MKTIHPALLLCVLNALFLAVPAAVQAQFNFTTNTDGSLNIANYTGSGGVVIIPDTTNGLPVTSIGEDAFEYRILTGVTIGTNVISIGDGAFFNCTSLTNVTIPNSVTSIGEDAFDSCIGLTSITISTNVTSIAEEVFAYCTGLTNVTIPNNVTNIGEEAFFYCTNLNGVIIPNSVISIEGSAFCFCTSLTGVTFGTNVTSIGDDAFYNCTSLTNVTIPNSVSNIEYDAFDWCISLTIITVASNNPAYSSVAGVLFNKGQTMLIEYPGGKAGGYTVPSSATIIGQYAFYACNSLTSLTIGNSVTNIEEYAFWYCTNLTSVMIGTNVTSIGDQAFAGCTSLTAITVATNNPVYSSVAGVLFDKGQTTLIGYPGGKAGSYIVPASVTSIGDYAFTDCLGLTSLVLGNSVTSIGELAFYYCTYLTGVTIDTNVTSIGELAFYYCTSLTNMMVPNSVTNIGEAAFIDCTNLTSVTIGTNVTSIGNYMFEECYNLTNVTIPNSVTSIGDEAFYSCQRLASVLIPNSVTSIGEDAFFHCTSLTNVTIPNGVTNIGEYAFYYCTNLTSVTISTNITNIGDEAFGSCYRLNALYFNGNAPTLGGLDVFSGDTNAIVYYLPGTTGWADFSADTGLPTEELAESIPTLAIIAPTAGLAVSNANCTITGTATDTVAVVNVFYALNNSSWTPATTANNWTNWSAPVTLSPGTNTIAAYAVNPFGFFSPTSSVSLDYVLNTVLTVQTNGHGTISPNYDGAALPIGQTFTMTATASPGYGFAGWTGSFTTNAAALAFVMASNLTFTANFVFVTNPTLTVTAPVSGQRWSNALFTMTGTAQDNLQVSNVVCQLNGGVWSNAATVNLWTNWTAAMNLVPGTNTVATYAVDTTGYVSATNNVSFQYVATNQLQIRANGLGTVSPNYSNAWLEIGRNYSITSAPAAGFVFTNWVISTNWIGGTTASPTNLLFMMASNLTLQACFVETSKPTLSITAPTAGKHMTNALATVVGTASDNWKVSAVWYQLTNGILTNGTWSLVTGTTNNYTNWTTTVTLAAGSNTVKAYAVDLGGNHSITSSVSVLSSNTFKLKLNFALNQPLTSTGLNLTLQLSSNLNGHIQVSTNLTSWATLTNFVGTNTTLNFRDPAATNSNERFYRAVIP